MNKKSVLQPSLEALPPLLSEKISPLLENFPLNNIKSTKILGSLCKVWACSDFLSQLCARQPHIFLDLVDSGDLLTVHAPGVYYQRLSQMISGLETEDELARVLRQFRQREMLRIAWRDIAGWANLEEVMQDLSALAQACIESGLDFLYQDLVRQLGQPCSASGQPVYLTVIAMGKLGAQELNFSSDIDLIFSFAENGEVAGGKRQLSHEDFFTRLGRKLIGVLDNVTVDGFVFRVDMRLRPFGDSGALVSSFDALEHYYQSHGREWERYAMVKAQALGQAGPVLMQQLNPFVYRRYLDFGAYDSLRDMKQRISTEMTRKGMVDNVKLGPGGIREIEFIGQAFQLIRGGRDPDLQEKQILKVLPMLAAKALLPDFVVQELVQAYHFLRTTEHRLQEFADQQTHQLPDTELGQISLAYSMGFADWEAYKQTLDKHRHRVHNHFEQVFEAPQVDHAKTEERGFSDVWLGLLDEATARSVMEEAGYEQADEAIRDLHGVISSARYRSLSNQGRKRMDQLIPLLLGAVAVVNQPHEVLKRLLQLVETVARRTSYLALLVENPMALSQLVQLCAVSPWINKQLMRQPILLDELLDPRTLYSPPDREQLQQDITQRMDRIDEDDLEQQMDALRHFKHANVLRVAAADISGAVPLMVVSDHLTDVAEVVLNKALEVTWNYMLKRHGKPSKAGTGVSQSGFAVVAYGKLGGIELGYGSDLDLVFLYEGGQDEVTDGEKPLANAVFYSRLGQRVIHLLTALTPAGVLYDVDMRLRPSGASGLLVTQLDSFSDYQLNKAWTWEHQAIVRARFVAGDPTVSERFSSIRRTVLSRERSRDQLKKEVREMRERLRKEFSIQKTEEFDLKQGLGGIADIEFMVQYAVLAHASEHPALMTFSDNIRVLSEMVSTGILSEEHGEILANTYRSFRAQVHRFTLQERPARTSDEQVLDLSSKVFAIWQEVMT